MPGREAHPEVPGSGAPAVVPVVLVMVVGPVGPTRPVGSIGVPWLATAAAQCRESAFDARDRVAGGVGLSGGGCVGVVVHGSRLHVT